MMTRFLHARLHGNRLQDLACRESLGGDPLVPLVVVFCPRCAIDYFADIAPDDDPTGLKLETWAAVRRLDRECPDHAHRFVVGG